MAVNAARSLSQLSPTTLSAQKVLAIVRWLAWLWMTGIVIFDGQIRHPVAAWAGVAAALAITLWSTIAVRRRPAVLVGPVFVGAEVCLALGLSVLDGYVFNPGHVFATTQSLATQWPLLTMATVGFAYGPAVAAAAGVLVGPAEWMGAAANGIADFSRRQIVSFVATSIFFAACGAVFGWLAEALQRAESEIADRRARDEMARVMHDTVLQTLALVSRRTDNSDPELANAARAADRDLRAFLFGVATRSDVDLEARIRTEVERVRQDSLTPVSVSVLDDGCTLDDASQDLVARAIGEAVANAHEHAHANGIVVFVETDPDGHIFASVNDDGCGFDPNAPRTSHGIDESIDARIRSIGGRTTINSATSGPRTGTEVLMWSNGGNR